MDNVPDPKDVQDFQFKQANVCQIFDGFTIGPALYSLLATDKKRGLLYIGHGDIITILKPSHPSGVEWKFDVKLPVAMSKISLSCDYSYIAVIPLNPVVLIYDVQALIKNDIVLLHGLRISPSTFDSFVIDIKWNPTVPGMLCTVASDHTVGSFQIKDGNERTVGITGLEGLNGLDVMCAAWSPKGKQIVVGCKNGNIVQLKPDLKVARTIPGPTPYMGEVISILWISNYQFCAAYLGNDQRINVLIVDAPKGEANGVFTCYEDITYGMPESEGAGSIPRYYFDHVPEWGIIIAGSSGSSEIAVLGSTDGGATWSQWQLIDSGRAQLPLIRTNESYPLGIAIDKTPVNKLPWGADMTLPIPVPILHILGTSGQLCSFHMVNLTPNCPAINSPPTEIVTVPPQPRPSVGPSDMSFNLNAATSTPRLKQPEITERPKPVPITNMFGDSLKAAGFFHQPEKAALEEPVKPPEEKTMPIVTKTEVLAPVKEISQPANIKIEMKPTPMKETPPPEIVDQKTIVDDSICIRAYLEEQSIFEKELRDRLVPSAWECGTEEERKQLGERAAIIDQFLRDLRETTNSLSSDIAYLKALLLQSFAWVEETKSKNEASTEITTKYGSDNSKVADLQHLYYYTHSQLIQATKALDLEWSDHNSQNNSKMKIPNMEMIYQSLVMHNKIILKQKSEVEYLKRRWKLFSQTHSMSSLNVSLSNMQIGTSKSSKNIRGNATIIEARCKAIATRTLNFSREKHIKLKNLLLENSPRIIKPVNPSPIQDRLEATLTALASQNPSVSKVKNKVQQSAPKQVAPAKQPTEKQKAPSPLASLNSIVARIGSSDMNAAAAQNKTQAKPLPVTVPFPNTSSNKVAQADKKPVTPTAVTPAQAKTKSDTNFANLSFPKANSISFGVQQPNSQEVTTQKSSLQESLAASSDKESSISVPNDMSKTITPLFSTDSLNNVLSKYTLPKGDQIQPAQTTVSFKQPAAPEQTSTLPAPSQQAFSFASKPFSFAAKPAPMTAGQAPAQNSFDLGGLSLDAQSTSNTFPNNTTTEAKAATSTELTKWISNMYMLPSQLQVFSVSGVMQLSSTTGGVSIVVTTTTTTSPKAATSPSNSASVQELNANTSAAPAYGSLQQSLSSPQSISLFGNPPNTSTTSMFGGSSAASITAATTTTPATSTFPVSSSSSLVSAPPTFGTPAVATTSAFSGFPTNTPAMPMASTGAPVSSSSSPFYSSPSKPSSTPSMTITFGTPTTVNSTASAFGKTAVSPLAAGSQFSNTPVSWAMNNFAQPKTTTTSPFGGTANTSVFGTVTTTSTSPLVFRTVATTSTTAPLFGTKTTSSTTAPLFGAQTTSSTSAPLFGTQTTSSTGASIFGRSSTTTIFGNAAPASTAASIFGGNSLPSSGSYFANTTSKPNLVFGSGSNTMTTPLFGGSTTSTAPAVANGTVRSNTSIFGSPTNSAGPVAGSPSSPTSVFGGGASSISPIAPPGSPPPMGAQPAFGQAFGAKPVFGSPPLMFDATKPVFGNEFGSSPFGAKPALATGFGSPPVMGGSPPPMGNALPKLFGSPTGSTTFESLASQAGGLTFGSLAQKSPEPEKPPAFSGGSSFSSWR